MLQMDGGNGPSHDGSEMQFKFAEIGGVAERHHACVVRTWAKFGEDNLSALGLKELYAPDAVAGECLGYLSGHGFGLLERASVNRLGLPAFTVIATLLRVSDRGTKERLTMFLGDGEQSKLGIEVDKLFDNHFLHVATSFLHGIMESLF